MSKKIGIILVIIIIIVGVIIFATKSSNKKNSENNEVVVYSPHGGDERGEYIVKKAKEEIGLDVKFISGGGSTLAERLSNEKENPQADVTMALNQIFLYDLKNEGVLAQYTPSWSGDLSEKHYDEDGYFYGFGRTPEVLAYNADWFKENNIEPPSSWLDLTKDEYKNLYTIAPLENQTTRMYLAGILWRFYDEQTGDVSQEGWEFMKKLYENAYSVENVNWDDLKNKTPIVLDWYGNVKKQAENYQINIEYVNDEQGNIISLESLALINGAPNSENGKKFIEWFGSAEVQADYAEKFFYFGQVPLNKNALGLCDTEIQEASNMFKEQEVDNQIIAEKLDGWIKKIELEIMQ